ncbi:hypothetical protein NKG99_20500 [Mesorhizobium sp. M1409]|uniref:hypothetical protein n=1 Tax=Mesorhizobium sp. M1409 TaxID=2957100 RepID=UPI003334B9C8
MRKCGSCTLCCRLLPVRELTKRAGQRCRHQRTGKGCAVYRQPAMPLSCALWNCRWLTGDDTAELRRPDHSHYVVDTMVDYVKVTQDGEPVSFPVVQVWCDPKFPDAWRDPALLAYLDRRGKEGFAALIRYDNTKAIGVFPPSITGQDWVEATSGVVDKEHSQRDIAAVLTEATGEPYAVRI